MEQSTLNENLRVPSRQSVKVFEHDKISVDERALGNAVEVNEIVQDQEAKLVSSLKSEETEKV